MIHLPPARLRGDHITNGRGVPGMARAVQRAQDARFFAQDKLYEEPDVAFVEIAAMNAEWLWAFMLFIDWVNDYGDG